MASKILITVLLVGTLCQGLVSSYPRQGYPTDINRYVQEEGDNFIPYRPSITRKGEEGPVKPEQSWTMNYYSGKNGIYSRFGQRGKFQSFPAQRFEQPYQPYPRQNGYLYYPRDPVRDRLAYQLGKIYQLKTLQKKLESIITKQTDTLLVEDLTRILKNSNTLATSTVQPDKLQKLRNALLTFIFSNSTTIKSKHIYKLRFPKATTSHPNVTEASPTTLPTSGNPDNHTVTPTTENPVAVTSSTSSPQSDLHPEQPSRLNLVKLLQIYGTGVKSSTQSIPTTTTTPGKGVSNILNLLG